VGRTREPEWQQNFNYGPISKAEFQGRSLDVSVWSKKKNNPDEFLGEVSKYVVEHGEESDFLTFCFGNLILMLLSILYFEFTRHFGTG